MDELLFLVFLLWIFKSISKRKKKAGNSAGKKPNAAAMRAERARQLREEMIKRKTLETEQTAEQFAMPVESVSAAEPGEGECQPEHAHSAEGEYRGSLMAKSTEGEDLCDPSLEHYREERPDPESVYAEEIGSEPVLDLSARGIYQGIVMSEVLTRPTRRRCR